MTRFHNGIDINASVGAAIVAADGGNVAVAGYNSGYGNYIMIYHSNGSATLYAHLSSMSVSKGDTVSKGQVIGGAGSTGYSTGPHLHFEIHINGGSVDPLGYFSGLSFYNC
ncbi:MAG: M23 family metallopeptidase [Clostridiaceae bacterium]|nr:M23 family metallopeptidase [Clostridiaceae bacterium]